MLNNLRRVVLVVLLVVCPSGCGGGGSSSGGGGGTAAGGAPTGFLPAGWQGGDIGAVGHAGSSSYSAGTFTVSGSGQDIWGTSDTFQFTHQPLTGDGTIVARVVSLDNTDAWAKSGVMIRESLNADSSFAMTVVTPSNGSSLQYRTQTGQACNLTSGPPQGAPYWVKLSRSGNTFSGSASMDGSTWTAIGDVTIAMGATVYAGLCVTAHNNSMQARSQIDSVALTLPAGGGGGGPISVTGSWLGQDIGAVGQAGSATYSGGTFTIGASGAGIWGGADAFYSVYQTLNGDGQITARVASLDNTDAWAKSGVMIRQSLNDDAAFAMTVVTPSNGTSLQYRSGAGQPANLQSGPAAAAPYWVRLSRSGSTFSGAVSSDGSTWSSAGTVSITMTGPVYIGMCVTSHNTSAKGFSAIDNVTLGAPSTPPPPPSGSVAISTPISRIVYQRNNSNQAFVPLRGSCSGSVTRVEARVQVRSAGQGSSTDWAVIDGAPSGGLYRGSLTVSGGWYSLEVRAFAGSTQIATASVDRVGVGEVFVAVGHSVAAGGSINIQGSTDERGITIPDNRTNEQHNQYNDTANPAYLPPVVFAQYSDGVVPAPFGGGPYFWAKFAQYVAQNQNVPVVFYNAAFGGTSLEHWSKSALGLPFDHSFVKSSIRMPYINLYNTLKEYIKHTGIRAVLADQGANDWPNPDSNQVFGYYKTWVDQARADLGYGSLAIVVNRHTPSGNAGIRAAQMKMINEVPNCFTGPDYDTLAPGDRTDGIHLSADGCWAAASKWAAALDSAFFSNSQPYLPTFP